MTPNLLVSIAIGALPIAYAFTIQVFGVRRTRAKQYQDNAFGLFGMRDRLTTAGPYTGPNAAADAETVHAALLDAIDRNARANAYLFNEYAAVFDKRSFVTSIAIIGYAAVMAVVSAINTLASRALPGLIVGLIVFLLMLVILATGCSQLAQRHRQRRTRKAIGVIDTASVEGIKRWWSEVSLTKSGKAPAKQ